MAEKAVPGHKGPRRLLIFDNFCALLWLNNRRRLSIARLFVRLTSEEFFYEVCKADL